ncbi:MAG: DNA-directed RNA polymerase subunit RpoH/Rpb5 C-terminal domain-containing protein [Candidatus Pacearchaeota archaeon]
MHILQPKHTKMSKKEVEELLKKYNISLSQLPKIKKEDPALPENCEVGDVIKIERKSGDKNTIYYRVVI